eukprot:CAMPEP_0113324396 /NCGR_PEP_ID=MMETSP0010_2-20120614/17008_1 /TAXON_ID=216773 ORGANISM="Corethron hystrix, Strain 308" /NCGR_SAMPLE_ID=MMETSP0010_2 /ASSEMBLY_ACC=CAM_ASM_000155 /LENGTH=1354 /DNA_ID=CAMNT_0000183743 /DNA_START=9 /DNA_END=4070 /DNA_ORIENTATION=- /assembly_acc=CAM_ASM_000155
MGEAEGEDMQNNFLLEEKSKVCEACWMIVEGCGYLEQEGRNGGTVGIEKMMTPVALPEISSPTGMYPITASLLSFLATLISTTPSFIPPRFSPYLRLAPHILDLLYTKSLVLSDAQEELRLHRGALRCILEVLRRYPIPPPLPADGITVDSMRQHLRRMEGTASTAQHDQGGSITATMAPLQLWNIFHQDGTLRSQEMEVAVMDFMADEDWNRERGMMGLKEGVEGHAGTAWQRRGAGFEILADILSGRTLFLYLLDILQHSSLPMGKTTSLNLTRKSSLSYISAISSKIRNQTTILSDAHGPPPNHYDLLHFSTAAATRPPLCTPSNMVVLHHEICHVILSIFCAVAIREELFAAALPSRGRVLTYQSTCGGNSVRGSIVPVVATDISTLLAQHGNVDIILFTAGLAASATTERGGGGGGWDGMDCMLGQRATVMLRHIMLHVPIDSFLARVDPGGLQMVLADILRYTEDSYCRRTCLDLILEHLGDALGRVLLQNDTSMTLEALLSIVDMDTAARTRVHEIFARAIHPQHPLADTVGTFLRLCGFWTERVPAILNGEGDPMDHAAAWFYTGFAHELMLLGCRMEDVQRATAMVESVISLPYGLRSILDILTILPLSVQDVGSMSESFSFPTTIHKLFSTCRVPYESHVAVRGQYFMVDIPSLVHALRSTNTGMEVKQTALQFAHDYNDVVASTARHCHVAHALASILEAACAIERRSQYQSGTTPHGSCLDMSSRPTWMLSTISTILVRLASHQEESITTKGSAALSIHLTNAYTMDILPTRNLHAESVRPLSLALLSLVDDDDACQDAPTHTDPNSAMEEWIPALLSCREGPEHYERAAVLCCGLVATLQHYHIPPHYSDAMMMSTTLSPSSLLHLASAAELLVGILLQLLKHQKDNADATEWIGRSCVAALVHILSWDGGAVLAHCDTEGLATSLVASLRIMTMAPLVAWASSSLLDIMAAAALHAPGRRALHAAGCTAALRYILEQSSHSVVPDLTEDSLMGIVKILTLLWTDMRQDGVIWDDVVCILALAMSRVEDLLQSAFPSNMQGVEHLTYLLSIVSRYQHAESLALMISDARGGGRRTVRWDHVHLRLERKCLTLLYTIACYPCPPGTFWMDLAASTRSRPIAYEPSHEDLEVPEQWLTMENVSWWKNVRTGASNESPFTLGMDLEGGKGRLPRKMPSWPQEYYGVIRSSCSIGRHLASFLRHQMMASSESSINGAPTVLLPFDVAMWGAGVCRTIYALMTLHHAIASQDAFQLEPHPTSLLHVESFLAHYPFELLLPTRQELQFLVEAMLTLALAHGSSLKRHIECVTTPEGFRPLHDAQQDFRQGVAVVLHYLHNAIEKNSA